MLCSVSTFGIVLLFLIIAAFFALIALGLGSFLRPNNPTTEKNSTYECGEETILGSWGKFNIRFYLIALVFVLFEVEIIFLFPWAKVLTDTKVQAIESNWQVYAFTEGLLFILILVMGLGYLWKNNLLNWQLNSIKEDISKDDLTKNKQIIPNTAYQSINTRYSQKKNSINN